MAPRLAVNLAKVRSYSQYVLQIFVLGARVSLLQVRSPRKYVRTSTCVRIYVACTVILVLLARVYCVVHIKYGRLELQRVPYSFRSMLWGMRDESSRDTNVPKDFGPTRSSLVEEERRSNRSQKTPTIIKSSLVHENS